jgi:hypothetical protein
LILSGLVFRRSPAAVAILGLNSTYGNVSRRGLSLIVAIIALHSSVILTLTAVLSPADPN